MEVNPQVSEYCADEKPLLQAITRDLWALRLRRLQNRVTYDSETDTEGQSQVFSSQSEGESVGSQTTRGSRRRQQANTSGAVSLSETLALCYIGMLLLRVPFTVADFVSRVDKGELLYYQAAKHVPGNLRERLPGEFQVLLEPQHLLRPSILHQRILKLATLLSNEFGMVLPPVNQPLLLFRWMQELALPIEVYAATQRLAHTLHVEFTLYPAGQQPAPSVLPRSQVLRYPEVQLMAFLVVSTKLFFPLDDIDRHPVSANDLSALQMDWSAWVATHSSAPNPDVSQHQTQTPHMTFPEAFNISETDCLTMGDEELDRYLDWYEENLASENVREQGRAGRDADFRRTLMRMFPTQSSRPTASSSLPLRGEAESEGNSGGEDTSLAHQASDATQRLRQVQHALRPKKIAVSAGGEEGDEGVPRAGSFYRRHREVKDLEGPVRLLYTKAADLAGTSLENMIKAVFLTERQLQKGEERARKGAHSGDDDDDVGQ